MKTTPKHTPGPWAITKPESFDETPMPIIDKRGFRVAWVNPYAATWSDGVDKANARLIAAAPELLDALRDILPLAESYARTSFGKDAVRIACAVVNKATEATP